MSTTDKRRYSLFPKTLAAVVEPLTRPLLKAQGLAGSRILTEWASIAGPELASHSLPEKLSFPPGKKTGGTLTISVENGFATHMQHMQPLILERIASYFGYTAVSRLQISHSWQAPAAQEASPLTRKPLPPECVQMTEGIEDDELKAALQSLARTLAEK
jgi:hypothetical protein